MLFIKKYYFQTICYLIVTLILLFSWSILKSEVQFAFNKVWNLYNGGVNTSSVNIDTFNKLLQPEEEQHQEQQRQEQNEPLGKIQVTTDGANIRTVPDVQDQTIAFVATKDDQFYYYEQKEVDGTIWYKIINPETQEQHWISSKTVKPVQ